MYIASFTGGKATSNLYKQADLSSQFTCLHTYFLKSWLRVNRQPWRAYIMCPVLKLCGAARVTPRRLRDACAILSASLPQSSPSTPIPTAYSLPPLFPAFPVALCVCVLARPWQRNLCLHRVLAVRPQIYLGESLPASRRMKSSRGAPNQKEIIFACQSTQYCTRKKRKSGQTTAEIR